MEETRVKEKTRVEEPPAEEAQTEEPQTEETQTEEAQAEETAQTEEDKTEETPAKDEEKKSKKKILLLLLLLLLIGTGVGLYFAFRDKDTDDGRIPYAEGVLLYGDSEVKAAEGWIGLTYNHQAFSKDGVNFSCLLTNDASNQYDMYFDIYADNTMKDEVFLSGLVRPGYSLQTIELNHALPAGSTMCYVVFNQVDTDGDGNQSIVGQVAVTVEFIVE